jgi:hypothetical protein
LNRSMLHLISSKSGGGCEFGTSDLDPNRDRDYYCIGSNFWKFLPYYTTGFTFRSTGLFGESVLDCLDRNRGICLEGLFKFLKRKPVRFLLSVNVVSLSKDRFITAQGPCKTVQYSTGPYLFCARTQTAVNQT